MFRVLALICTIWGFNFVVMKVANEYFSPEIFVVYRFGLGAAILVAFAFLRKLPLPPRKFWGWIALTGILQISLGGAIVQFCFKYLSAGMVSVLNYTMPMWVTLLAALFLNEKLTRKKIFGVALAIVGVAVLMGVDVSGDLPAILLALAAAMFWALSNVIVKAKLTQCNPIALTTWQMVVGAIFLTIYAASFGEVRAEWTLAAVACLLYNAVIASALAFFLWVFVLEHMQASKASIAVLGVPVVGVLSGVIFLGEPLTISIVLGMAMVLSGIVIVQHS
ncbi:MAG: EamA family transporter [Selenomonadaceae bacterium]|nr:EamA family transporter [Selenomonadaceae bacterium]